MKTITEQTYKELAMKLREEVDGWDRWSGEVYTDDITLRVVAVLEWDFVKAPDFEKNLLKDITPQSWSVESYDEAGEKETTDFNFETLKEYMPL